MNDFKPTHTSRQVSRTGPNWDGPPIQEVLRAKWQMFKDPHIPESARIMVVYRTEDGELRAMTADHFDEEGVFATFKKVDDGYETLEEYASRFGIDLNNTNPDGSDDHILMVYKERRLKKGVKDESAYPRT